MPVARDPSHDIFDLFDKRIKGLEATVDRLNNNMYPTVPIYDWEHQPQDAIEGQVAVMNNAPPIDVVAGPPGPTGGAGPTGPGVPAGGTTGQALVKTSNTDYDTHWTTIAVAGIPPGGDTGQFLVKASAADYDAIWSVFDASAGLFFGVDNIGSFLEVDTTDEAESYFNSAGWLNLSFADGIYINNFVDVHGTSWYDSGYIDTAGVEIRSAWFWWAANDFIEIGCIDYIEIAAGFDLIDPYPYTRYPNKDLYLSATGAVLADAREFDAFVKDQVYLSALRDSGGFVWIEGGYPYAAAGNEIQSVNSNTPPTTGTFKVTWGGNTTAALNYNATSANLVTAMSALPGLSGNIQISSVDGPRQLSVDGYLAIEFIGSLAGTDVAEIVVTDDTTDGSLTASTDQDGYPAGYFQTVLNIQGDSLTVYRNTDILHPVFKVDFDGSIHTKSGITAFTDDL